MKFKIIPVLCIYLVTLLVAACDKEAKDESNNNSVDEVVDTAEYPTLMDTWEGACASSKLFDLATQRYYKYAGNNFVEAYALFSDEKCTQPVGQLTYTGTIEIADEDWRKPGIHEINYHYTEANLQISDEDTAAIVKKFCDIKELKVGEKVDVSKSAAGDDCPILSVPRDEFGLFEIKESVLYLEDSGELQQRPNKAKNRPNAIDEENPMTKSQKEL